MNGTQGSAVRELARGLRFPEGPIAMDDGSVVLVEIARGTLTRVRADGAVEVIAELGGGPNGAAIGPDGKVYVCNNGGFVWHERDGLLYPGEQPPDYSGGRIERVDPATGTVETLYTECDGVPLRGPNDLVFDRDGGFWFTDHGKTRPHDRDRTGVFYAAADGSRIERVIFPLEGPNGVGLSPEEDALYVAETLTGRVWEWELDGPGRLRAQRRDRPDGGRLLPAPPGYLLYDSLAVDAAGRVCVATLVQGGITVIDPKRNTAELRPMDDVLTTNVCFGGEGLRTAYVTLSTTGRLVALEWDEAGLPLNFHQR
ncbi:MAG: SMP-30/gluconolactonase/LRE family protein [Pseudomonadales bacterium]|jgi:gluconolactonase|nr:SMP-30/gluconolactonase/LRE family protein [Pseudomonadales bacterium]